jgi:Asp-tRNA(Asn)/Glu-tRNA(Gln) amidotransferase A subunit family amidase
MGVRALAKSQWSFSTAVELTAALKAKKVSSVELAQDAIGRIERHDGKINAICVRDFDRALDAGARRRRSTCTRRAQAAARYPPDREGIL